LKNERLKLQPRTSLKFAHFLILILIHSAVYLISAHRTCSSLFRYPQDFRYCQTLIHRIGSASVHSFPPSHVDSQKTRHEALAAKNVQRGLAAKVQDLSAKFRKKQRVYMASASSLLTCSVSSDSDSDPRSASAAMIMIVHRFRHEVSCNVFHEPVTDRSLDCRW
jgi:hypothetical protein